jgi:hypothetical protein
MQIDYIRLPRVFLRIAADVRFADSSSNWTVQWLWKP